MVYTLGTQWATHLLFSQHYVTAAAGTGPWLANLETGAALSCSTSLELVTERCVQFFTQAKSIVAASLLIVGRPPPGLAIAHGHLLEWHWKSQCN